MLAPCILYAQNATNPGVPSAPFPTLNNLTIEWPISGDDNENGWVGVRYREVGSIVWQPALPLRRVPAGSNVGFSWSNRHSGSVFDLAEDTSYEVELTLTDPDGGSVTEIVVANTRPIPAMPPSPNTVMATPATLAGIAATAQAGDVIVLQPGTYAGFNFPTDGDPGNPIVLQGMPGAVIEGELGLFFRHDVLLTGLTVNGRIRFNGSDRISIVRNVVNASPSQFGGDGIVTFLRSEDAYIADNIVVGTSLWTESAMGASGDNRGEGILVTGPGHVIEHNRVQGFRDGISFLEGSEAIDQFSIDVIENDISESLDDAIEADFCHHNCRILRNRATNSFIAFSSQPGLGGPTWFIRNAAYNVAHVGFKLYRSSVGDVLIHNTVVKSGDAFGMYPGVPVDRLFTRNNLFLGAPGEVINGFSNGSGRVLQIGDLVEGTADMDYDAFGTLSGTFEGNFGNTHFDDLAELNTLTTETNAVTTSTDTFATTITVPDDPLTLFLAPDLRLHDSGSAVDTGVVLPGINDNFSGTAPDAGAYEVGQALPEYGPRLGKVFADGFEGN